MLYAQPPAWAHFLPGYGPMQVLLNGALSGSFDETGSLLIALAWLAGLTAAAALVFRRTTRTSRAPVRPATMSGQLPAVSRAGS